MYRSIVYTTMAQNNNQSAIINSCSLFVFSQKHGTRVAVGNCTNSQDGSTFKALSFTDSTGKRTIVHFGKSLEGLTLPEIIAMKDELQVVQLAVKPETLAARQARAKATGKPVQMENYSLCKSGSGWQEVDLQW